MVHEELMVHIRPSCGHSWQLCHCGTNICIQAQKKLVSGVIR